MAEIEFKLIPEKIPKAVKFGSKYDDIIDAFDKSDKESVRVDAPKMDMKTLSMGLRTRIRQRDMTDIKVSMRGDKVYLARKR